jgi:kynurenine formamidase
VTLPRFAELPQRLGAPAGSSWGVFGDDDEHGTLNFIGPEQVIAAASLIRSGKVFPLNWDVKLPAPALFHRRSLRHELFHFDVPGGITVDDYLDDFYLQGSSQWDALRHFGDAEHGFYNGATLDEVIGPGDGRLGIERIARRGIVARGVLLDVARALAAEGAGIDPFDFFPIDPGLLERTAAAQGVELRPGDVLLVRTGWVEAYDALDAEGRTALAAESAPGSPGLYGDDVPAFLWDLGIAAVAADNPALEASRPGTGPELGLHRALIARLGMPLGELWALGALAEDCSLDRRFEVFLASAPLNLSGGAGSPPNALAVK